MTTEQTTEEPQTPPPVLITTPERTVLGPITTEAHLSAALESLVAQPGPIAVDTERASGYRYSQRAYLVQLARSEGPIVLVDPVAFDDLSAVSAAFADAEWIVHAASQDLPCLREAGIYPGRIFDTEVAGRLLGYERVSLNAMLERFLGVTLEKGHSAADWSTRPLPQDWLLYAALDVDLLVELRGAVAQELDRTGKRAWAEQEFEAALAASPTPARVDPWRRTSGIHALRTRRQLAVVRALWESRDEMASARDIAPGRLLPDSAIIAAARTDPVDTDALVTMPVFRGPRQRMHVKRWFAALDGGRSLPEEQFPGTGGSPDGMPAPNRWRERNPLAAARLAAVRATVTQLADEHAVQAQNLLAADVLRRLCWYAPEPLDVESVTATLAALGARQWQIELCAAPVAEAMLGAHVD